MLDNFKSEMVISSTNNLVTVNNLFRQHMSNAMNYGLTCYEAVCSPREIIDESKVSFSQKQIQKIIKEILRCNICYEIYNNPVSIKGCLHKFCKNCIGDYNWRIKKECAVCRHPIETKRLLKEDDKLKKIIDCFIPNVTKFKEINEKYYEEQIKNCLFKEENFTRKNKSDSSKNENSNESEDGNSESESFLGRKRNNDEHRSKEKSHQIIVRINCDERETDLLKYFKMTRMKIDDSYNLEFISRFICFKQNLNVNKIQKIHFYTYDSSKKKKNWSLQNFLKDVVAFDAKNLKNSSKELIEEMEDTFYQSLYHLNIYFCID